MRCVEREHALEPVEPGRGGVDVVLEARIFARDGRDLRGEHALALARGVDLVLERVDPGVDAPPCGPRTSCPAQARRRGGAQASSEADDESRRRIRG